MVSSLPVAEMQRFDCEVTLTLFSWKSDSQKHWRNVKTLPIIDLKAETELKWVQGLTIDSFLLTSLQSKRTNNNVDGNCISAYFTLN